jgi:lipoprotein LprG
MPWMLLLALLTTLVLAGCGVLGGNTPPTPVPPTPTPTPAQIAQQSAAAMAGLKSAHFILSIEGQPQPTGFGFQLLGAEGDVVAPDKLKARLKARLGQSPVDSELVVLGKERFLKNPFSGKFEPLMLQIGSLAMLDPDHGAPLLLRDLQNPTAGAREQVDGVDSDVLSGTLNPADLTALFGGTPVSDPVQAQVWIGTVDRLVRKVRLSGPIATGEPAAIVRTLTLSGFNQDVTIERPA